jgi:hypothetical protein
LWKVALRELANDLQLDITVCHFPPGTSKWNKIEHRLFSFISQNWRGRPLLDLTTIVNLISHTTTSKGLTVRCAIDDNRYEKGIKVSDAELNAVGVKKKHPFSGGKTMGKLRRNYSKSFQQVQDRFTGEVGKLFETEHQGRECTNAVFIRVLFCALCHAQSLFAVCRNLQRCPDDRTVAVAILKTLPEYDALQKRINETLAEGLPKNLRRGKQRLAIDLVLIPYHGKPAYHENEIYRSQPKSGTSHFHAYATCCVIKKGFRYTVALTLVTKGEEMKVVLQRLLKQCKDIGITCGLLLVDRGFYSVSVISYLKHAQVPFMMPVVIRGKKATKESPAGGTRKYASWKKSGFDKYEISTKKNGKKTSTWFAENKPATTTSASAICS